MLGAENIMQCQVTKYKVIQTTYKGQFSGKAITWVLWTKPNWRKLYWSPNCERQYKQSHKLSIGVKGRTTKEPYSVVDIVECAADIVKHAADTVEHAVDTVEWGSVQLTLQKPGQNSIGYTMQVLQVINCKLSCRSWTVSRSWPVCHELYVDHEL